jgi:hypothetical protein
MRREVSVSLGLILCLLFGTLSDRSWSRTGAPKSQQELQRWLQEQQQKHKERQAEFQRKTEEQRARSLEEQKAARKLRDEYSDEAWQEALGATAEQWQALRPRLERIRQLKDMPHIEISIYAFGGSAAYQGGGFAGTSDGGRSTANASGGYSATRGVYSTSDSSNRSGRAGGYGQSFAEGGANVRVQTPGPVRKQVGDVSLGWQWQRPSLKNDPDKLSDDEKACERLLDTLETAPSSPEQIRQQVEGLRRARQRQLGELQQARQRLREIVTPEQEAKLILMGYLD